MAIMARKFIKNCRFGRYYVMHSYNFFLAHGLLFNKRPFETKLHNRSGETADIRLLMKQVERIGRKEDKKKSLNNNK